MSNPRAAYGTVEGFVRPTLGFRCSEIPIYWQIGCNDGVLIHRWMPQRRISIPPGGRGNTLRTHDLLWLIMVCPPYAQACNAVKHLPTLCENALYSPAFWCNGVVRIIPAGSISNLAKVHFFLILAMVGLGVIKWPKCWYWDAHGVLFLLAT